MRKFLLTVTLLIGATAAHAEKLGGQQVATLLSQGPIAFEAGSVGIFRSDGTFEFKHRSSSEKGTFRVFSNGNVEILDTRTGKKIVFYFDKRPQDAKPALIYKSGTSVNGKRYPMK
ncbi:hypothetical protein [Pseudoponticoccus marisrubri]|uniref:Uncharacterized protein n=1 Tax=Pseudoponticoccus marisrubri TaxID=1685382 RepID=A0A0W7WFQ9_9RHOB|nr:hypothetical protein [Pseudoponticoccus marisrubri]KUF09421.1 hypothetical protein AVJ23_17415 [Pseudoponticoccus marisrubri]